MKNIIYSDDENTCWIDGVEYHTEEVEGYGCYQCDIYKLYEERLCEIEHCVSCDRKDHRDFLVWKKSQIINNQ